jgi:hypothetical protein
MDMVGCTFFVLPCVIAFYEDLITRMIILTCLISVARAIFGNDLVISHVFITYLFDVFNLMYKIIQIFYPIIC